VERLVLVLRIQAAASFLYGVAFLFGPDFTLDTIFGWAGAETDFARMVGVLFLSTGWFGLLVARRLESRLDMVWPLVLIPTLLLAVLVAVRAAGNYGGSESFYWTSGAVTVFFAVAVGGSRLAIDRNASPPVQPM
jgi:hypothetical protein